MRLRALCAALLLTLSNCTDTARVFPMNQVAMTQGVPKFEFVRQGLGRGPVTVTMPDGEILQGEYQITENAAVGIAVAGARTATAIGYGSNRHTVIAVSGPKTIMNCDAETDIGGHGSGVCQTGQGAQYRVMF